MKTWDALVEFNDAVWAWIKGHPRTAIGAVSVLVVLLVLKGLMT